MNIKKWLVLILCGVFIGVINGFFGGGGGMVCVPTLRRVLGFDEKESHATAIFIMLPISIASSIIYITLGGIQLLNTLWTTIGVVVGGVLGAILLKKANSQVVNIAFAFIMLTAGIRLLVG